METPIVSPVTTQAPAGPAPADNPAGLSSTDIAAQIEALGVQPPAEPAPEPGINQTEAPPVPPAEPAPAEPAAITQEEPKQQTVENVGPSELERIRIEKELLEQRYSASSREAIALAQKVKELEAKTAQVQEQTRRYTDDEVDAFVQQNPQYESWAKQYKRESIILEAKETVRKEMEEREAKIRYNTEANSALEKAKREFPEAFKTGTPMQKLAAEIFQRSSFRNDPNGVYYAAELAKARLIPASTPAPAPVPGQTQQTANTPFIEKGGAPNQTIKADPNNLSPEAASKMSLADLAKLLPRVEKY